ncbi:P-loop containing nucleoside triphosphate hydrolase protein [Gautieria morchelliformis]|nr:P-loop containing nucleoside triphosphate hydrolase protein [Gautieria morchelliformis]
MLRRAETLRNVHPKSSLVFTKDRQIDILAYPSAVCAPLPDVQKLSQVTFVALARRLSQVPGMLVDRLQFATFRVAWKEFEFLLYIISTLQILVHDHPHDQNARQLLLEAGVWGQGLHDEVWVFDQGFWAKDHKLWLEFKNALRQDVNGFFASEQVYKDLSVPWKRGLIMYGPPGNGKTISVKTIMKTAGYPCLYVRSFKSFFGEEASMRIVFDKAREYSPCVVILEDLDALINDQNRSFFLNQLDGLESNDGLLVIATTNHFDRLDAGLSKRPSRFDRKYLFSDPDMDERVLYIRYWQEKLKNNKDIEFPDTLLRDIAELCEGFSFAYLKEAFVSALILLAGDKSLGTFEKVIKEQIKLLKKQLEKDDLHLQRNVPSASGHADSSFRRLFS